MALDNVPVAVLPDDATVGINLNVRSKRGKGKKARAAQLKMDLPKAKRILPDNFSILTACLLGRFKILTRDDLISIYLSIGKGGSEGLVQSLVDQFGLPFNITNACGGINTRQTARNKLGKALARGGFRTMEPPNTSVRVLTQMYDEGLSPFIALSRKGAKAMTVIAKDNGKKLLVSEIEFPPDTSAVAIPQWLHERQVGDLLALTIVGAHINNGARVLGSAHTKCDLLVLKTETTYEFFIGESKHQFRPDIAMALTYEITGKSSTHKRALEAWIEHDTTSNTPAIIQRKVRNYLHYVIKHRHDDPPYLLLTTSSEDRMHKTVERAVTAALKEVIGQSFVDYTEQCGRIACATFDDLAQFGTWGDGNNGVWRQWDFKKSCFSSQKRTLPTLGTVVGAISQDVTASHDNHPVDIPASVLDKKGASAPLVGYTEDETPTNTPALTTTIGG